MTAAHDTQALAAIRDNARKFAERHAAELARELIDWQDTALLCGGQGGGGELRELAEMMAPFATDHALQVAQSMAERAALEVLASRLQEQEGQPSTFPARILTVLHELADRKGTATHGPAEDANGEPLQDDADAALAWIAARQEERPVLSEKEAFMRTLGWQPRATLAAGSQAVQVPEATQDELLELAEALERRRCITISETVKTEQARFEKDGKPTAFSAGFTLACEEIAHRIEHEEWVFQDPGAPLQPLAGGEVTNG